MAEEQNPRLKEKDLPQVTSMNDLQYLRGVKPNGDSINIAPDKIILPAAQTTEMAEAIALAEAQADIATGKAIESSQSASTAQAQAGISTTKAGEAQASANEAEAFKNAAELAATPAPGILNVDTIGRYYTSIQDAIDASSDGDTIIIYPGVYSENITIENKNGLKLQGIGAPNYNGSTIAGGVVLNGYINAGAVIGLSISNIGIITSSHDGIFVDGRVGISKNINIENVIVKNSIGYHGIILEEAGTEISNNTITRCEVYGGTHGFIIKCRKTKISECRAFSCTDIGFGSLSDNGLGASLVSMSYENTFMNCTADSCAFGFIVYTKDFFSEDASNISTTREASQIIFSGCSMTKCAWGLLIGLESEYPFPKVNTGVSQKKSARIVINGCNLYDNAYNLGYGIRVAEGEFVNISGTTCMNNQTGFSNKNGANVIANGCISKYNSVSDAYIGFSTGNI